jgi:hypothetical protein
MVSYSGYFFLKEPNQVESSSPYRVSINNDLINTLALEGVKPDDLIDFATDQIEQMLLVEPNYKKGARRLACKRVTQHNQQRADAWVMRGYYPDTSIPLKITITSTKDNDMLDQSVPYFVKVRLIHPTIPGVKSFDGAVLRKRHLERAMEQNIFGASSERDTLCEHKIVKPRCMSPGKLPLVKCKLKR